VVEPVEPAPLPSQTPLYHALNADRYDRQDLIRRYEAEFDCRLVVLMDHIFPDGVTLFEELVHDADPEQDLHLLLNSAGGDGESALRILRSAQARCRELRVVVPDEAKSAATLVAMGAHSILMGPSSDLGPVDPQLRHPATGQVVPAKDLVEAWDGALITIDERPATLDFLAVMFAGFNAPMVQEARSVLDHTSKLVEAALGARGDRSPEEVDELRENILKRLQDEPKVHTSVVNAEDARDMGLPVVQANTAGRQWQMLWRLYTKYYALNKRVYEFCLNLMGPEGMLYGSYEMVRPDTAMAFESYQKAFLRSRANSIEGGTTEVMKNILGERVLGLPGEPRVDKNVPWREVPRS
jgi:hypothetical protein